MQGTDLPLAALGQPWSLLLATLVSYQHSLEYPCAPPLLPEACAGLHDG